MEGPKLTPNETGSPRAGGDAGGDTGQPLTPLCASLPIPQHGRPPETSRPRYVCALRPRRSPPANQSTAQAHQPIRARLRARQPIRAHPGPVPPPGEAGQGPHAVHAVPAQLPLSDRFPHVRRNFCGCEAEARDLFRREREGAQPPAAVQQSVCASRVPCRGFLSAQFWTRHGGGRRAQGRAGLRPAGPRVRGPGGDVMSPPARSRGHKSDPAGHRPPPPRPRFHPGRGAREDRHAGQLDAVQARVSVVYPAGLGTRLSVPCCPSQPEGPGARTAHFQMPAPKQQRLRPAAAPSASAADTNPSLLRTRGRGHACLAQDSDVPENGPG
jgi:hypothetical protein